MFKKILIFLLVVFIVIQFFRPERNLSATSSKDIAYVYDVPDSVQAILKKACYDCHSNYTTYPWYSNIQPLAWWLQHHIDEGKEHLNFSEFASYELKKQAHKMEETAEMVEHGEMPLYSYTLIHTGTRLTKPEVAMLVNWASALQAQIEAKLK